MSRHLSPVFGAGLRRAARLIRLVGLAALLTSCAVPATYGPYYRPTYLGPADEARLQPTGKSPAPPRMLWIEPRNRQCGFLLWAAADEANLVLSWSVSVSYRDWGKESLPCKVVDTPLDAPLLIQDLDTGRQISVRQLRTVDWFDAPRLDIRQEVDLASLIPRYGAAPPSERRYTVSFRVERKFDGPLPERVTIQLPDLMVEGRRLRPPALVLQRGERYTSDTYEYVPVSPTRLLHSEALAEFGGHAGAWQSGGGAFAMALAGTYVWHDEPNVLRLASTFSGYPYAYKEDGNTKDATKSTVWGRVHVEVLSGERLRLAADTVTWRQTPGDATSVTVPVSNWELTMYTPARFGDSFERFLDFRNRPWGTEKSNGKLLAVIPGFQPKRFRVILPTVVIDGREHPLAPIEFEYRPGGVGLAVWP